MRRGHVRCITAYETPNAREGLKVVKKLLRHFPNFFCRPVNCRCLWKKNLVKSNADFEQIFVIRPTLDYFLLTLNRSVACKVECY